MALRKLWKRPRIFVKMFMVVVCAIVLSVSMCSAAIYLYLEPIIRRSFTASNEEVVHKMLREVTNSLEEISLYATNISFDDIVQQTMLTKKEDGVYDYYWGIQRMERKLKEYAMLRGNLIYDICVLDNDNQAMEMLKIYGDIVQGPIYEPFRERGSTGVTPPHIVVYNISGSYWDTVAHISDIYYKEPPYRLIGKLAIMLNVDELARPVMFDPENGINIELRHSQAGLIYSGNPARNLEDEMAAGSGNGFDYIFRQDLTEDGWYALCSISNRQVSESLHTINIIIIGIVLVCMAVMLTVIGNITANIVRPLETLVRGMQQVSGGSRTERITVKTGDEIEDAALVFNQMVGDIDAHTRQLLESERKEHEAQLKMLLYQINPHFIYNTLNCVICLARKNDCDSIIILTRVFIMLLRTILRIDPKSMTTLREEMDYINRYVSVLQFSYNNVPDLVWEVDEGLLDTSLPKLILYPLVENSIFYGVIPQEGESGVTIRVSRIEEGDGVEVRVIDTGRGLSPEDLAAVRKTLKNPADASGHIGLSNVNSRLTLIYGPDAELCIDSEFGRGTCASFTFRER